MERALRTRTVTRLLREAVGGGNLDELAPRIYDRLRRLAASKLDRERSDHTLEATALANEAWMRLARQLDSGFEDRVLRVSPDILPPGAIRIDQAWIDDAPTTDFDAEELTVRLPRTDERVHVKVRVAPTGRHL